MAVFIDGKKVGYAIHSRIVEGDKVKTTEKANMTINRLNVPVTMKTEETSIETLDGKPLGFESVQDMSFMQTFISGVVEPNGTVIAKTRTGQFESTKTFAWPDGALMAEGLRLVGLEQELVEGNEYSARLFSPSLMMAIDVTAKVGEKKEVDLLGRVVKLTEVTTTMTSPMTGELTSLGYVDDELNALKAVTPMMGMNIEMVTCSKEFALSKNDTAELMETAILESPKKLDKTDSAKSIQYTLRLKDTAGELTIPETDNQKVEKQANGTILVTVTPVALKPEKFPYKGKDEVALENLKSNRFVQSDSEKIKSLAKEAVGRTKDAAEAVKKIEAFVAKYIDNRNFSVGYATALEVAESKKGDCSEFSVLTAALCRAVGIPARIAVGVAYVEQFGKYQGVFGGHAWTEVYVDGKWIGLDASFASHGLDGYGSGHITLSTGNGTPEGFMQMVFSIGQFEIVNVKVEK